MAGEKEAFSPFIQLNPPPTFEVSGFKIHSSCIICGGYLVALSLSFLMSEMGIILPMIQVNDDSVCREPSVTQGFGPGLVTSAYGSLSVPQSLFFWSKLEKHVQPVQRKLVSGTHTLAANMGLQSWVLLRTFSFLFKQITLVHT